MWYFAWVLCVGFAVFFAILIALWGVFEYEREQLKHHHTAE